MRACLLAALKQAPLEKQEAPLNPLLQQERVQRGQLGPPRAPPGEGIVNQASLVASPRGRRGARGRRGLGAAASSAGAAASAAGASSASGWNSKRGEIGSAMKSGAVKPLGFP